jgi:hypothetical protein
MLAMDEASVSQTVFHGPPVLHGCPQAVYKEKALQKLYQTLNE